jgi:hypothetical protein
LTQQQEGNRRIETEDDSGDPLWLLQSQEENQAARHREDDHISCKLETCPL